MEIALSSGESGNVDICPDRSLPDLGYAGIVAPLSEDPSKL